MKNKFLLGIFLALSSFKIFADENLDMLLQQGLISSEEYQILKNESFEEEGEVFYNLMINGEVKSNIFEIFVEDQRYFIPIKSFFELIQFKNYTLENGKLSASIGESLDKIEFDSVNKFAKRNEEIFSCSNEIFEKNGDIYLESEIFKKIFLKYLAINKETQKINMTLSFTTPEDIRLRMKLTEKMLQEKTNINELVYTNQPTLFELGYLRVNATETFSKDKESEDTGWEKDWEAYVEYQGATLFGELTTNYNFKTHSFKDIVLRYDEVYTNHMLEIGSYEVGDGGSREWELNFRKDKGYYITGNKNYIIKENVEIGSRVELLYLDTVIDIQEAVNGVVEFSRAEIKEDREYKLRIYTPEGKVYEKIINTTSNYNQQNKGEFEYDISLRENHDINKVNFNSNVYYGLTDTITIGGGFSRTPEEIQNEYKYLNKGNIEGIYSSSYKSIPYTLKLGGSKILNNEDYGNNKNTGDNYSIDFLGQVDFHKLRLKFEHSKYGAFYENKNESSFSVRYSPLTSLDLEYSIDKAKKRKNEFNFNSDETTKTFSAQYSKSFKDILISGDYQRTSDVDGDYSEYGLNLYYTAWRTITTRLENRWNADGEYEVAFSLFNNGNNAIDYNFEARYSEANKDSFTLRFSMKLDNWFRYEGNVDKHGSQSHKFGVDRIVDLKNPKADVRTMDSSRVKVITFVDLNNNNILDEGERRVEKVEVKIGEQKVLTDENGEATFYGIPNQVLYDLKPEIRKPNFLLGNNKIQVKGTGTSTIIAYIPIKPMVSLTGIVNIDRGLNKTPMEKMRIYDEILVQIKDLNGKVLDMAIPDNTGIFEISGLFPEKYFIEVQYTGLDFNIKGANEIIQLTYVEEDKFGNRVFFTFNADEIIIGEEDKNG